MRRLPGLAAIVTAVAGLVTLIAVWAPPAQATNVDKCPEGSDDCTIDDSSGADTGSGGEKLTVPKQREAYCPANSEYPLFSRTNLPQFLTADDKTISRLNRGFDPTTYDPTGLVIPDIAVAQRVYQWCSGLAGIGKSEYFWVPLATVDSVALNFKLLAKVQGLMTMPTVTWLDANPDDGWLYVNLEHHLAISPPVPVNASARDGNEVTGYARAWIKATPVSLTLELPSDTGVMAAELATCDLRQATSQEGCAVKFKHGSSIVDDGWFRGIAKITWEVTSNSGKYNGVGPFTTTARFEIQVAEVMAVGQTGG